VEHMERRETQRGDNTNGPVLAREERREKETKCVKGKEKERDANINSD